MKFKIFLNWNNCAYPQCKKKNKNKKLKLKTLFSIHFIDVNKLKKKEAINQIGYILVERNAIDSKESFSLKAISKTDSTYSKILNSKNF